MPGKKVSKWLEQFFSDIKDGQTLINHLEILQTTSFFIICSLQHLPLSEIVETPGYTHLFFAPAHLVIEIGGLCNASVARFLVSLIQYSLRLQVR